MSLQRLIINISIIILMFTSCFKKPVPQAITTLTEPLPKVTTYDAAKDRILTKTQRESIFFAASLEKEALKLLLKNPTFDELTLFSVLSYAVESHFGIKKVIPQNLDCARFRFEIDNINKNNVLIYNICQKPDSLIARIEKGLSSLKVIFFIKEWAQVVGLSVTLTGTDIICDMQISDNLTKTNEKKLTSLNCYNWARAIKSANLAVEEMRLKVFSFNRMQANQFILQGVITQDLIERRKIEMQVPLEGKIQLIEKEIEVIDEYADAVRIKTNEPANEPRTELPVEAGKSNQLQITPDTR